MTTMAGFWIGLGIAMAGFFIGWGTENAGEARYKYLQKRQEERRWQRREIARVQSNEVPPNV